MRSRPLEGERNNTSDITSVSNLASDETPLVDLYGILCKRNNYTIWGKKPKYRVDPNWIPGGFCLAYGKVNHGLGDVAPS